MVHRLGRRLSNLWDATRTHGWRILLSSSLALVVAALVGCAAPMPGNTLYPAFEQCGPATIEEVAADDRLTIIIQDDAQTTRDCFDKMGVTNDFAKGILAIFVMPLACAYYEIYDDPCKPVWTVYAPTGNKHLLDHELRHVMGYKDVLY